MSGELTIEKMRRMLNATVRSVELWQRGMHVTLDMKNSFFLHSSATDRSDSDAIEQCRAGGGGGVARLRSVIWSASKKRAACGCHLFVPNDGKLGTMESLWQIASNFSVVVIGSN
jgi:hypothetical protein